MKLDDIDRILSCEPEVVPSSGFAESVMDAVRREAEIPQPIPFPWRRAVPGFAACAVILLVLAIEFVQIGSMNTQDTAATSTEMLKWMDLMRSAWNAGANWVTLALAVSFATLAATKRLIVD